MVLLPSIREIWLFGSHARGDATDNSDVDILVVSDSLPDKQNIAGYLPVNIGVEKLSISHYTEDGISALIDVGSLFTWHIKLEGRLLFSVDGWLARNLAVMPAYTSFGADLEVLREMTNDAMQSVELDGYTIQLEASIFGVALRNAAMMVSYVCGKPIFSSDGILKLRTNRYVRPIFDGLGRETIENLVHARLVSERGIIRRHIWNREELIVVGCRISEWLSFLGECLANSGERYESSVSASVAS